MTMSTLPQRPLELHCEFMRDVGQFRSLKQALSVLQLHWADGTSALRQWQSLATRELGHPVCTDDRSKRNDDYYYSYEIFALHWL